MTESENFLTGVPLSRRNTLKLLSFGALTSLLGYSRFSKPQPTIYNPPSLNLPRYASISKKVVVVGAGLAGLACAYELSQRGFQVTLLERSPYLGGKIASWPIQVGEETLMMEHGFHGFFPQYYNLNHLVEELDIQDHFQSLHYYSLVFRDNDQYQPEVFRPSNSAFPWNIVDLGIASPNRLRWGINLTKMSHWQVFRAITSFRIPQTYERLDHLTVSEWVGQDFPQGLYDLYFLPFAKSTLNAPDTLSAGELLQFFHFYFFGNPEGLAFNGTQEDMGTSLVQPMVEAIKAQGGQVIPESSIKTVNYQGGKIQSLSYYQGQTTTDVPFWVDRNLLIQDSQLQYYGAGDRVFAVNPEEQKAISLSCTHQGCTVSRQVDGKFLCPCHGALYDSEGKVLTGPARRNLDTFQVQQQENNRVQLLASTPNLSVETIEADYYVFAADVLGVKHLLDLWSESPPPTLVRQIEQLTVADPFAVARFWFDQDFVWPHSNFASLSGYHLTDSITLYHRIQGQYQQWSQKTGGSVVELHAYCYKEQEFPNQEVLLSTFTQELYQIVPSLVTAQLLHRELVNQKNFSGYPPHSYQERPETTTSIPNLYLAGDWVKMPFPCGLMERAVSSGLLAANSILTQEALQTRTIFSVNPAGFLQI